MAVREDASFRDPSGFIFVKNGEIYRQVNKVYAAHYDFFMESGLYTELAASGKIVSHSEADTLLSGDREVYKIIKPEKIPFITYPYEWSFSQYKDAALLTLEIQKTCMDKGMILKDASAYNIQFVGGKPFLIDTLSFEKYEEGMPWVAYNQFCRHFLAPLALMSRKDIRFRELMRTNIDGIPLDLASSLLPGSTFFDFSILSNIHMHAKSQKKFGDKKNVEKYYRKKLSKFSLMAIIDSLETGIRKLKWKPEGTEWADYYSSTNYTGDSFTKKKEIINEFIDMCGVESGVAWDLGANTGVFSRITSEKGIYTLSCDIDPAAVEKNYISVKESGEENLLPLIADLNNPSPAIGWNNRERKSLKERGPADIVFALALIHHLAISNNLPFKRVAEFFAELGKFLVIEFVPKDDSQVQKLLMGRRNIFDNYDVENFEKDFSIYFKIIASKGVPDSKRVIYLMKREI